MKFITLDYETYWASDFTLSKLTTEEYVRDPRFEAIIMGYKVDDGHTMAAVGQDQIQMVLDTLDIENSAVLCHHSHFDGLILSHHFGHKPKVWFDTLSMARAIHGFEVGGSLAKLLAHYNLGVEKGDNRWTLGMRLADFGPITSSDRLMHYIRYCCDDVEGTYRVFRRMLETGFPKSELKQIDRLVRMFTEPTLLLDEQLLRDYAQDIQANKLSLLFSAGVTLDEVMSAEKFAEALRRLNVEPPMKISPTTGKLAYAFAKTDRGLKELEEHPDVAVQTLVAARLGNKTTINETRALRMASMSTRGAACLYYKYAGAMQTMRVSGGDGLNWQNLTNGTPLREGVYAPEGYLMVVVDSRNIESRVLDYIAMQEDMLEAYRLFDRGEGPDIYCVMATRLYQREITVADKLERKTGKHVKLGCFGADTRVLSSRGIVRIVDVKTTDMLWDGVEWVNHQGLVYQGRRQTQELSGVHATPDHLVLMGDGWRAWHEVHTNHRLRLSALATASLSLWTSSAETDPTSLYAAVVADGRASWPKEISSLAALHGVIRVPNAPAMPNATGNTKSRWTMMRIAHACSIDLVRPLGDAIANMLHSSAAMVREALSYVTRGATIVRPFFTTSGHFADGMTPTSIWTDETPKATMSRATSDSAHEVTTLKTNAASMSSLRASGNWRSVYDIAHAGPRNRFTIMTDDGPMIVHNCGYQMGHERLRETARIIGGLDIPANEAARAVAVYRDAHQMVGQLWNRAQSALAAIASGPDDDSKYLDSRGLLRIEKGAIILPNTLRIKYPGLSFEKENKWSFSGRGAERNHIYGGKVVEHVTQGLAKIVVMDQTGDVGKEFDRFIATEVMTTHDEGAWCVREDRAEEVLEYAKACLSVPPKWAPDMPVAASGGMAVRFGDVEK